jgi:hypothetical protein
LPSCEVRPDCKGRQTYLKTCYTCHSLELKSVPHDRKLGEFIQRHLVVKAPDRISDADMKVLVDYLSGP